MTTTRTYAFSKVLTLSWLTGPIFDKELRVSSRRRRNYVLRFAYLVLLSAFVILVWFAAVSVQKSISSPTRAAQSSLAGIAIVAAIVNFQFWATQLLAVVMLSAAISDEIHSRTLGILMTTPINSFQIVMGKLLSRLLQLILLMAITVPLLALVRVFGGVPWNYVFTGFCITLTALIFAGSLSLYFSIHSRHAHFVILKTVFTLACLYGFFPAIIIAIFQLRRQAVLIQNFFPYLMLFNPVAVMQSATMSMISPAARAFTIFPWPIHCALMLGASALMLAWSTKIVRRVALRQAAGQIDDSLTARRTRARSQSPSSTPEHTAAIRYVTGSPIIWKELRSPIIQGAAGRNSAIGLLITIISLGITYAVFINNRCLDKDFTHVTYTLIFVGIGLIINTVLSATTITSEKETSSWPILLTTPLNDWHILLGKAFGVFRRCLPVWALLAGHVILFIFIGYIHPIALPQFRHL